MWDVYALHIALPVYFFDQLEALHVYNYACVTNMFEFIIMFMYIYPGSLFFQILGVSSSEQEIFHVWWQTYMVASSDNKLH